MEVVKNKTDPTLIEKSLAILIINTDIYNIT
jgi:hypothetical protein